MKASYILSCGATRLDAAARPLNAHLGGRGRAFMRWLC